MAHATPYYYKALNTEAYSALAAFIATSSLDASFFPKLNTIVVTPKEDEDGSFKEVGKFIDDEGLKFLICPIIPEDEVAEWCDTADCAISGISVDPVMLTYINSLNL